MEEAVLARHAESAWNVEERLNGDRSRRVELTEAGRAQARLLGERLGPVDLAVTSEFLRARQTADVALAGRGVPRLVLPDLNEIAFGRFEGGPFPPYGAWAAEVGPLEDPPGGGESRASAIRRIVRGYGTVLARPERTILVVAHGLVVRYVLDALEGRPPARVLAGVEPARPYRLGREELERAVALVEDWVREPAWG